MHAERSRLTSTTAALPAVAADLLVLPVSETDELVELDALDGATQGEIGRARRRGEFRAKPFEQFVTRTSDPAWQSRAIMLIGVGPLEAWTPDRLRKVATAAALGARQRHLTNVAFVLRGPIDMTAAAQAIAEGLTLAEFDAGSLKTGERERGDLDTLQLVAATAAASPLDAAAQRGRLLGTCSNLARGLANEPGNLLTPTVFADRARAVGDGTALSVDVLGEAAIGDLEMGLLLGVSRGSAEPAQLIVLRYEPPDAPRAPVLGLVGKGVTFDTGGISLKPPEAMDRMKDDMAGGAAVIAAMRAIAELRPSTRVIGVVPVAENMPGGRAIRPGDVLRSASGKTVEILNTDAEGRLILADALWYARREGATHLIDVATLTGACVIALGRHLSGLFGTPRAWVDVVAAVAEQAGDRLWPLPLGDEYAEQLRSEIADLTNSGGRPAGAITAAMFLKEFAGPLPWAHLDVAGTAWSEEASPYQPKGPTGVAVRTLAELACARERWAAIASPERS